MSRTFLLRIATEESIKTKGLVTLSGQNSSKAPQPQAKKAGPSKPKSSSTPSQRKPQTKASNKVDNKKKGKGRAPVKNDPKGKGKARA
ncbi:hypothetical protein JR316_0004134 [Psilocybe cubensis]|uniref:Uncharacterized protein n=2 Tax=Psilocybe cubensis TaxID=181762 RepID=A0A8H8CNR5_PSICU|nr:hypothetical protein JR316_0004134 [Psilocybe cubensis]KAH9484652.1 hypothetical protein JR316_0004134 [Psilocybe cubensis]